MLNLGINVVVPACDPVNNLNTLPCPTYSGLILESPAESGGIPVNSSGMATVFQKVQ
jgi:hypothetical protein